jgi:zinc/manganese transport system substrate-binding protein
MKDMRLVFASGKGLESYLGKLRDSLGAGVPVLEVGETIPSLKVEVGEMFLCCPDHSHGGIDPHWWHSADNMERAARIVADALASLDPEGKDAYRTRAATAAERFEGLKRWARQQLAVIPRSDRKLVTAHAAYAYFCKEYGLKSVPLLGLGAEDEATAQHISHVIKAIRENGIKAVFPEDKANPKVLAQIAQETGIKIGRPLVADGTAVKAHTFEAILQHNITAIVEALSRP